MGDNPCPNNPRNKINKTCMYCIIIDKFKSGKISFLAQWLQMLLLPYLVLLFSN